MTSDLDNLPDLSTHTMNICDEFLEILPLSVNDIASQMHQFNGRGNGQTDGEPENVIPPPLIVDGGIKL